MIIAKMTAMSKSTPINVLIKLVSPLAAGSTDVEDAELYDRSRFGDGRVCGTFLLNKFWLNSLVRGVPTIPRPWEARSEVLLVPAME